MREQPSFPQHQVCHRSKIGNRGVVAERSELRARGIRPTVARLARIGLDIDTPEDLQLLADEWLERVWQPNRVAT